VLAAEMETVDFPTWKPRGQEPPIIPLLCVVVPIFTAYTTLEKVCHIFPPFHPSS
jgi:hypothetical protein